MRKTGSLTIKLSTQLSARVARLAKRRGTTQSEVVRSALEALPDDSNSTGSLVARFPHVVGIAKALPKDLSTNPRHLKGYGR